ncbi:prolyl oligopeptidase family serine peptidase [Streptomyces sp. NPDC059446]|uniref:extracellular catalytic domain type 1 short-chain-length polyhydroxyalkanoate depolymerase n=1 Tax=Streptomyces sp. NPDC059446 TaxID=3346833 RepID=UPI0036B2D92B
MVRPTAAPSGSGGIVPHRCPSAWNPADRTHDGQDEARSVVQMVDHVKANHAAGADRVFASGYSGGGAATNVMLAAHPEVFKAGAVFFGMAYGCADTEQDYFRTGSLAPCPGRYNLVAPHEWGDEIRSAHPGRSCERPRVQLWHGGSDPLINQKSMEKQRDGWTDVFGIPQTPSPTSRPASGVTKQVYGDGQVETYLIDAMGHEAPVDPGTASTGAARPAGGTLALRSVRRGTVLRAGRLRRPRPPARGQAPHGGTAAFRCLRDACPRPRTFLAAGPPPGDRGRTAGVPNFYSHVEA